MSGLRFGVRLSAGGDWAVAPCMTGDQIRLEWWHREPSGFVPELTGVPADPMDQLLPIGDRIVRCSAGGRVHIVSTVDADGTQVELARLTGRGARLLGPAPGDPDRLPWSLRYDAGQTVLSRVGTPAATGGDGAALAGTCTGGVWLAPGRLALGYGRPTSTVVLDVATGACEPLFHVTGHSNDLVQAVCPESGLMVVHTDAGGTERLGYALSDREWRFPDQLAVPDGTIEALAVQPGGRRILAHVQRGVRSLLRVFEVPTGAGRDLPVPDGCLAGTVAWSARGLVVPWSAPGVPVEFLRFGADLSPDGAGAAAGAGGATARVVSVPGAAGPIEAIAYGGADWLHRPRLILALHGGPLSAWRLSYDPLLERLADRDTAVLAINQRGSTGYGYEFAAAIRSGWAGVDLADVLSVARYLVASRAEPVDLLGFSYGGYLALAAACRQPELWRACAAVSAFSAPHRLAVSAPPAVSGTIHNNGGLNGAPPDVVVECPAISAPVLLVHGAYDETVAVQHARELASNLGPRARYVEIPAAGHDLNWPSVWDLLHGFFTNPTTQPTTTS